MLWFSHYNLYTSHSFKQLRDSENYSHYFATSSVKPVFSKALLTSFIITFNFPKFQLLEAFFSVVIFIARFLTSNKLYFVT